MIKRKYFTKCAAIFMALGLGAASLTGCGGSKQQETKQMQENEAAKQIDNSAEDTEETEGMEEAEDAEENIRDDSVLRATFTDAYAGIGDDENYYFMAFSGDGASGIFVILSGDGTQSLNLVGPVEDNGDGSITITDTASGSSSTFAIEIQEDESYILTLADDTKVHCGQADASEVIDIIVAIDNGTEIVNPFAE